MGNWTVKGSVNENISTSSSVKVLFICDDYCNVLQVTC